MATANFNTEIYSSRSKGETKLYVLDDIIDKDFDGPYAYTLNSNEVPEGVVILVPQNRVNPSILSIPPNLTFDLEITVYDEGKVNVATATTNVTVEPDLFIEEINKFLNNQNLQQNLSNTKSDWVDIIKRNTKENADNGIKYPGDAAVNPG